MYNPDEKEIDLDREYSPVQFSLSGRYDIDPEGACKRNFEEIALKHRKSLFQSGVICESCRYAEVDDDQVVDIFYKKGTECKPSPLFVFIPGAFWLEGFKEMNISMVGPLVKNGYRVAVVDYNEPVGGVFLSDTMHQFCDFAKWIFEYAERTQTTDITFAGHGYGAHLLALLLHMSGKLSDCGRAKVKSMFFLTGVYDMREHVDLEWIASNMIVTNEEASDSSPMLWSWKDAAQKWGCLQIHVLTVEHTSVTYQEQSRQFSQVLECAGFNSTFKQLDGLDHFTILLDQNEEKNEITNYIKTAMQKASSGSSKGSNRPCTCASKR